VKLDKRLKMAVMILLIILISIISFAGIYVQEKNSMVNCLKEYQLGMDLTGARIASVEINKGTKTIYYDKEGKVVETEAKDGKKEEIPINSQDSLTKENYLEAKKIVTKRLEDFGVSEYTIRQDEATGKMVVALPENAVTDTAMQYIYTTGKFTIENENNEVLLDNSNIKSVKVGYGTTEQGTSVNLSIEFKKDAKERLKEITTTYVTSKDEEGKDNSKKVSMKLDETTLFSTSFSEEIQDGTLIISIGNVSTNNSEINASIQQIIMPEYFLIFIILNLRNIIYKPYGKGDGAFHNAAEAPQRSNPFVGNGTRRERGHRPGRGTPGAWHSRHPRRCH